jgi:GlpG protein
MRQIGSIEGDRDAERFSDYLLTQGIGNMVEEQGPGGAWAVWVEDDDHLDRGRVELEQFRTNPGDARYDVESKAQRIRKQSETSEKRRRAQYVDVRTRWSHPASLARPVTIVLAAISIIASIAGTRLGLDRNLQAPTPVANAFYIAPVERVNDRYIQWDDLDAITKHGQVWRLVTPIFLHANVLHLVFNMFWLFDLGSMIETRRGSLFLLVMVLVTAATSNLAQYYLGHFGTPNPLFGGMSGVNYALFGYAWMKGKFQPHHGIGVAPQTVTVMLFWLVLCMTGLVGPVANVAHVVGLLGGITFAYVPYRLKQIMRRP